MTEITERVAVLEAGMIRNQKDITEIFKVMREHMEKEEADRVVMIDLISDIKQRQLSQKSFVGGIVISVSGIWAVLLGLWHFFK